MAKGSSNLALDMTADPDEFSEAVNEFSARRIITREEADGLELYARRRAWWISGVAQMDVVNDVHESIKTAMRNGTPFEKWKREIGPKLEAAWGRKDSDRILTIFRNATTQAYNAGRWEHMQRPHVKALRPYVQYDVVGDTRTSKTCKPLRGVILPIDDEFVLTHNPPLHHKCRTGLRSMRSRTALAAGVTQVPPEVNVTPGFGFPPHIAEIPKPSERANPPSVPLQIENTEKAIKDSQKRKPVKVKIDPKHTPEYWADHYREKYGDAAQQVGYGRAVHERAKVMSAKEAHEIVDSLLSKGVPGVRQKFVDALVREQNKRPHSFDEYDTAAARLLAQHFKLVGVSRSVPEMVANSKIAGVLPKNAKFWSAYSSPKLELPGHIRWDAMPSGGRAAYYHNFGLIEITAEDGVGVAVHEYAHAVERLGNVSTSIERFMEARTSGEVFEKLSDLYPELGYTQDEITRRDKFYSAYIGKQANPGASELFSTVSGDMASGKLPDMLDEDPETVYFVLGLLAGI